MPKSSEPQHDFRPIPDPTALTTEALHREIASLKELVESKLAAEHNLKEEKFRKVDQRFELIETQRIEQKRDAEDKVKSALQAVKESNEKSEGSFTKQIDGLKSILETKTTALDSKIDDNKARVVSIESRSKSMGDGWGFLVGAIGVIAAIASVVVMLRH
jgi:hypothetical protein